MPSFAERMDQIFFKFYRAAEHLKTLEAEIGEYIKSTPVELGIKIDDENRPVYFITSLQPVPKDIALIAGDVIQNLVTTLDHLAYQLVCIDTNDAPPNVRGIYFPISKDEQTYNANKTRKLRGANEDTVAIIDAIKPYGGGNNILYSLHQLNNIEKHRVLLTVGSQATGVELAPLVMDGMPKEAIEALREKGLFLNAEKKWEPLHVGYEVFKGQPNQEPQPDLRFKFGIGLYEKGVVEEKNLARTLFGYLAEVKSVIDRTHHLLKRGN